MLKFKVDKLIRDKIPQNLRAKNITVSDSAMTNDEFIIRLKEKLIEEVNEVVTAKNREELIEELADLSEVINSLSKVNDIKLTDIEKRRIEKAKSNGVFNQKIYCSYIEIEDSNPAAKYYLDRPKQYPEM